MSRPPHFTHAMRALGSSAQPSARSTNDPTTRATQTSTKKAHGGGGWARDNGQVARHGALSSTQQRQQTTATLQKGKEEKNTSFSICPVVRRFCFHFRRATETATQQPETGYLVAALHIRKRRHWRTRLQKLRDASALLGNRFCDCLFWMVGYAGMRVKIMS